MAKSKKIFPTSDEKSEVGLSDENSENLIVERVGILFDRFIHTISYGPHTPQKEYKSWLRGAVIDNEEELQLLLELNAPIKVYFRYVD